jgi:hypothetical protein
LPNLTGASPKIFHDPKFQTLQTILSLPPPKIFSCPKVSNTANYFPSDAGKVTTQLGTPRGRYDEHSSRFYLSKKARFIDPVGKSQTSEGDVG